MLDEILIGLSATVLLRISNPSSSTGIPEVNQTSLQIYGLPSGYYNEVYFKELVRFDVVHSVQAIHELISLLERILEFFKHSTNLKQLGGPQEVYHDMRLINDIVNICHSVIHYNALPFRSLPDVIRYLSKLKSKQIREIVKENREGINEKYSIINKEHEKLADNAEDPNILKFILFHFFYE
ncbi:unnamed protein product [Angiostrongylus costaricensis]|uniref:Mediator of RNA polymerase II transcription subunit 7 n=1 Tax=Angiostrongylus costaricensis TaxID=334426 RepID=A0A0R3PI36_ANGCS|nr:unnamed protein product [Angiostrongylus costaricensis]